MKKDIYLCTFYKNLLSWGHSTAQFMSFYMNGEGIWKYECFFFGINFFFKNKKHKSTKLSTHNVNGIRAHLLLLCVNWQVFIHKPNLSLKEKQYSNDKRIPRIVLRKITIHTTISVQEWKMIKPFILLHLQSSGVPAVAGTVKICYMIRLEKFDNLN